MSSYGRQTQSKAQNDSNVKILRALVKQPDNKVCADCKRNDPRWASWNIGCFLCIRCSGIHRSMGTHISKVKSIDLDIWTPEQMTSIQQWGNKRSNLYWEAHLKPGHIPPEHKVESFIRSKYEVKRWAKDGPVPSDPSTLEVGSSTTAASVASSSAAPLSSHTESTKSRAKVASAIDLLGGDVGPGSATTSISRPRNSSSLLDSPPPSTTSGAAAAATSIATSNVPSPAASKAEKASGGGGGGLFDLDWHSGPTSPSDSSAPSAKGNKKDILSLYSNTSPPRQTSSSAGLDAFSSLSMGTQQPSGNGSTATASNPWGATPLQQQAPNTNRGSTGMFNSQDVWGVPAMNTTTGTASSFGGNDLWGEMTSGTTTTTINSARKTSQASQNDAFADIWK